MGACCSCQRIDRFDGFFVEEGEVAVAERGREREREREEIGVVGRGDGGARVRLQGSSKFISMYSQQGKKGLNQDAMTVWENFCGEKDTFFCGVFDGHGPSGHDVARYVRDVLPSKLTSASKLSNVGINSVVDETAAASSGEKGGEDPQQNDKSKNPFYYSWKSRIIKSFKEMDDQLEGDSGLETYCSGTTAVTILKQRDHLIVANLGDSRAIICTTDDTGQLVAEQLTTDLKPNLPGEAERIRNCHGRVMAMEAEPNVFRIWMPDEDCPGLAMARAFGDFCLKDFGLISIPQVSYRRLSARDEFVVLATDGIWDVLSNDEVIRIVASARKRSMAARLLVDCANRAWRYKYPCAKIDDCAVICIYMKRPRPLLTKSLSEVTELSLSYTTKTVEAKAQAQASTKTDDALDTLLNYQVKDSPPHDDDDDDHDHDPNNSDAHAHARRRKQRRLAAITQHQVVEN